MALGKAFNLSLLQETRKCGDAATSKHQQVKSLVLGNQVVVVVAVAKLRNALMSKSRDPKCGGCPLISLSPTNKNVAQMYPAC